MLIQLPVILIQISFQSFNCDKVDLFLTVRVIQCFCFVLAITLCKLILCLQYSKKVILLAATITFHSGAFNVITVDWEAYLGIWCLTAWWSDSHWFFWYSLIYLLWASIFLQQDLSVIIITHVDCFANWNRSLQMKQNFNQSNLSFCLFCLIQLYPRSKRDG